MNGLRNNFSGMQTGSPWRCFTAPSLGLLDINTNYLHLLLKILEVNYRGKNLYVFFKGKL